MAKKERIEGRWSEVPEIGERLRKARRALGLSQQAVAKRAQVAVKTLQRWETGEQKKGRVVNDIVDALLSVGASIKWLAEGTEPILDANAVSLLKRAQEYGETPPSVPAKGFIKTWVDRLLAGAKPIPDEDLIYYCYIAMESALRTLEYELYDNLKAKLLIAMLRVHTLAQTDPKAIKEKTAVRFIRSAFLDGLDAEERAAIQKELD